MLRVTRSKHRPASCRSCGRSAAITGPISRAGLCPDCGAERMLANHRAMLEQEGPEWERYRAGVSAWLDRLRAN